MRSILVLFAVAALAAAAPTYLENQDDGPIDENSEHLPIEKNDREERFIVPIYNNGQPQAKSQAQPQNLQRAIFPTAAGTNTNLFSTLLSAFLPQPATTATTTATTGATPTLFFYNPFTGIIPIGQKPATGRSLPTEMCDEETPECQTLMLEELLATGRKIYEENPHLFNSYILAPSNVAQNAPTQSAGFMQSYPQNSFNPFVRHSLPQFDLMSPNFANQLGMNNVRFDQRFGAFPGMYGAPQMTFANMATHPVMNPSLSHPSLTHPSLTHPSLTHSSLTHPSLTHPSLTHPSLPHPSLVLQALMPQAPHLQNPPTAYQIQPQETDEVNINEPMRE